MFWKKKEEDKGLPDLPPVKPIFRDNTPLANIPEEPIEKHALPTFPDTPISSKFSEAAIKEAVEEKESHESEEESVPESEEKPERRPIIRELEEAPKRKIAVEAKPSLKKSEDVYVKIDRFHSARKSLTAAKGKLHEINELLKKIRETRMREDQELQSWEKEIDTVKSKIEDVTSSIFEKVE
jgi:hypothetical protein